MVELNDYIGFLEFLKEHKRTQVNIDEVLKSLQEIKNELNK